MEKLYKGHIYGSLTEIDENNVEKEIYLLVSFDEEPYNILDCIHSQAGLEIMTRLEYGMTLLTKEMESEIVTEKENMYDNTNEKKYEAKIYSKSDSNYIVELEAKILSERLRRYDPEIVRLIKNWLENVYQRAKNYNREMIKTTHWFERVFTFIKTGQKTRFKEIKEIFQMSEYLYKRFDFYFEEKPREELYN